MQVKRGRTPGARNVDQETRDAGVELVLSGVPPKQAAGQMGVSHSTLRSWMARAGIVRGYRRRA